MLRFQHLQLAQQAIKLNIGDARCIEHVIAVIGIIDAMPQLGRTLLRGGRR